MSPSGWRAEQDRELARAEAVAEDAISARYRPRHEHEPYPVALEVVPTEWLPLDDSE